jgi:hypothetical protein
MTRQAATLDQAGRKALFDLAQRVFAEQLPSCSSPRPGSTWRSARAWSTPRAQLLRPAILAGPRSPVSCALRGAR